MTTHDPKNAFSLLKQGFHLANQPGIRRYVWIPLVINILLFAVGFYYLSQILDHWMQVFVDWLPAWLNWLTWILWPLIWLSMILLGGFCFSSVANLLAAPFNSTLSLKVEQYLRGNRASVAELPLLQMIGSSFQREWKKITYWLPRAVLCGILFLIPGIGHVIAPWCWLIFSSWMTAIEYCDYPYDNHQISFPDMRRDLAQRRGRSFSLGLLLSLLSTIPLVNLIIMPVGVCAATLFWVQQHPDR